MRFVAERAGAKVIEVVLPFPDCPAAEVVRRVTAAITGRTVLAVLDHVTSPGALVLPLADMVAACRERGVAVLVDGAHAPGQLPLELDALGADWYAGNLHKWLLAPVGSGFLHARRDRQEGLHPTAISHGLGQGFTAEFDWTGTRDVSGWLAVPDAIALHERLGGAGADGAQCGIGARGGGDRGGGARDGGGAGLCAGRIDGAHSAAAAVRFREWRLRWRCGRALVERRVDAPVVALAGGLWSRVSAQLYNEEADYGRLASVIAELGGT